MKQKVYITRPIIEDGIHLLKEHFDLDVNPEEKDLSREEFFYNIKGYDGVLCMLTNPINHETFEIAPSVKVFANYAVGFDNINIKEATDYGVAITNTPYVLNNATAELAWALLLATARNIIPSDAFSRKGVFNGWDPKGFLGLPITGRTLGIIGAGRIGQAFAEMAIGFKMNILYNNPSRNLKFETALKSKYVSLETIMKESDFITIHCPYSKATHHLISKKELNMMKHTAVLINTARGPIVDEKALYYFLKNKKIFGAGLDVYEKEPLIYPGLKNLNNAVLCPHIGSGTFESRKNMAILAAQSIIDILIFKKIPDNCLNKSVLK